MVITRVKKKIENFLWARNREKINLANRDRLNETAKSATIISMNCNGGIISHDLGLRFNSPTVNLFMRAEDFIKFSENLSYYLSIDSFTECRDREIIGKRTYPIAFLGDITLFLVHYGSLAEAQKKWDERKRRVNWNNIVVLNTDREGMTEDLKDRFENLPYRKVMFTHLPDESHKSCFYIKGYENESSVGIITDHNSSDGKRPIDQYDYVKLLNGE